ncbi:MAG: hypothetical protein F6K09_18745 [Merismopedia sp. SIO2A8]|nr:hypothetical protein [Merismopedia sp. SIO2A8]
MPEDSQADTWQTGELQPSSRPRILKRDRTYTFADYFKLRFAPADILAELGLSLTRTHLSLTQWPGDLEAIAPLKQRIGDTLPHVSLTSEMARREILIAPIIIELIRATNADLNIEYPIEVNAYLKGDLDYLLSKDHHHLLIIEAKQADLTRGSTQLAVELMALHRWVGSPANQLFTGVVSTGDMWQFGRYEPDTQTIPKAQIQFSMLS